MALPIFKSDSVPLQLMQSNWSSQLNPIIVNPGLQISLLKDINLVTGNNVINHKLQRNQQGWYVVDITGVADIYRNAPLNNLTLTLNSSANVTVSLMVF
jgi:hypothetical protein